MAMVCISDTGQSAVYLNTDHIVAIECKSTVPGENRVRYGPPYKYAEIQMIGRDDVICVAGFQQVGAVLKAVNK